MATDNIHLEASLHINSQMAEFRNRGYRAAERTIRTIGMNARKYAQENVEQGRGPGPHPHRWPYIDTGNLKKSVGLKIQYNGVRMDAVVYTNLEYGTYLEVGWRARNGRFYRYPWLKPAWKKAMAEYKTLAAREWKQAVRGLPGGVVLDGKELETTSDHYQHMADLTKKWQAVEDSKLMSRDEVTRMVNFGLDPDVQGYSVVKIQRPSAEATASARSLNRRLANAAPSKRRHDSRKDNDQEARSKATRGNVRYSPGKAKRDLNELLSSYDKGANERQSAKDKNILTGSGLVNKETIQLQNRLKRAKKRKGKRP